MVAEECQAVMVKASGDVPAGSSRILPVSVVQPVENLGYDWLGAGCDGCLRSEKHFRESVPDVVTLGQAFQKNVKFASSL